MVYRQIPYRIGLIFGCVRNLTWCTCLFGIDFLAFCFLWKFSREVVQNAVALQNVFATSPRFGTTPANSPKSTQNSVSSEPFRNKSKFKTIKNLNFRNYLQESPGNPVPTELFAIHWFHLLSTREVCHLQWTTVFFFPCVLRELYFSHFFISFFVETVGRFVFVLFCKPKPYYIVLLFPSISVFTFITCFCYLVAVGFFEHGI